jgi:hypothetical protein
MIDQQTINTLNAELNPICHLLTLSGAHPIVHINSIRVKTPVIIIPTILLLSNLIKLLSVKSVLASIELKTDKVFTMNLYEHILDCSTI